MESDVSATLAARSFSDLLNRVLYRGESFVVHRGGEPVCRILPVAPPRCTLAEFAALLREAPKPDSGYWEDLAAITQRQPSLPEPAW